MIENERKALEEVKQLLEIRSYPEVITKLEAMEGKLSTPEHRCLKNILLALAYHKGSRKTEFAEKILLDIQNTVDDKAFDQTIKDDWIYAHSKVKDALQSHAKAEAAAKAAIAEAELEDGSSDEEEVSDLQRAAFAAAYPARALKVGPNESRKAFSILVGKTSEKMENTRKGISGHISRLQLQSEKETNRVDFKNVHSFMEGGEYAEALSELIRIEKSKPLGRCKKYLYLAHISCRMGEFPQAKEALKTIQKDILEAKNSKIQEAWIFYREMADNAVCQFKDEQEQQLLNCIGNI